ncbi:MAG TPA: hypothetical protein VNF73_16625, partial [Candidatus Saccharimonadales bacterium]|nr:hypothetical protein [Candidatus Saccharimonadales bacterium]
LLDPCIPRAWAGYEIDFRYRSATYTIVVENPHGVSRGVTSAELDGRAIAGASPAGGAAGSGGAGSIPLVDDGATHAVRVVLG